MIILFLISTCQASAAKFWNTTAISDAQSLCPSFRPHLVEYKRVGDHNDAAGEEVSGKHHHIARTLPKGGVVHEIALVCRVVVTELPVGLGGGGREDLSFHLGRARLA